MQPCVCRYVPLECKLRRDPESLAWDVIFRFELTPTEFVGQPDESQHTEQQSISISVTDDSFFDGGIPRDNEHKLRVLYWYAVKTLERGEDSLDIDAVYAAKHQVDSSRIVFPPTGPFSINRTIKMGFHT